MKRLDPYTREGGNGPKPEAEESIMTILSYIKAKVDAFVWSNCGTAAVPESEKRKPGSQGSVKC